MNEVEELKLRVQALREALRDRVASVTDDYENRIIDLRIQLTQFDAKVDFLEKENKELKRIAALEAEGGTDASAGTEDSNDSN